MSKRQQLVLIGNGMAGMRTIDELLKLDATRYDITVIGAEPRGNYNRIMLSPVLAGEQAFDDIVLHDLAWYEANQIRLISGVAATAIDCSQQHVHLANGDQIQYDKLLIATGSVPMIVPVPGHQLQGVISFRDMDDVSTMLQYSAQLGGKAVVIGGGLLGLEAASGLKKRGMQVSVVHRSDVLMNRQLDQHSGQMLQQQLQQRDIDFYMGANTAEMLDDGQGHVRALRLDDGTLLEADLVIFAIGIRPNTTLAHNTPLAVNRGIVVNQHLQSSIDNVYAVGECIEFEQNTYGLVAPLYQQAISCAHHLAEQGHRPYQEAPTATKLKVTGIELFSAGNFIGDENSEEILYKDPHRAIYKKLVIQDNKIVGINLYGDTRDGAWYFDMMTSQHDISALRADLIFGQIYTQNT